MSAVPRGLIIINIIICIYVCAAVVVATRRESAKVVLHPVSWIDEEFTDL